MSNGEALLFWGITDPEDIHELSTGVFLAAADKLAVPGESEK